MEKNIKGDWVECKLGELSIFELGGDWEKHLTLRMIIILRHFVLEAQSLEIGKVRKEKQLH